MIHGLRPHSSLECLDPGFIVRHHLPPSCHAAGRIALERMGVALELVPGGAQRVRSAMSGCELDERGLAGSGAAVLLPVLAAPGLVLGGGQTWRGQRAEGNQQR